jgi:hypothetical protein
VFGIFVAHSNAHPSAGPKGAEKLEAQGIETTYQLIGKYLSLKGPDVGSVMHQDLFWLWLKESGIASHRSAVVKAIAEKAMYVPFVLWLYR